MNKLEKYFYSNDKKLIHKWVHYFDIYDEHFHKFIDQEVTILEIGVSQGGSLQMWKDYFGPRAKIYGIDIDPRCKDFEEEGIEIFIGSQSDRNFLETVKKSIPKLDILIDDGGHTMEQQIVSFEVLYDHVKSNGIYLCEDVCTSYWLKYGGGYRRNGTFIEYAKNYVDTINAYHSQQSSLKVNDHTKTLHSLHFYDSIVIFKKKLIEPPKTLRTGTPQFEYETPNDSIGHKIFIAAINKINKFLRFFGIRSVYY